MVLSAYATRVAIFGEDVCVRDFVSRVEDALIHTPVSTLYPVVYSMLAWEAAGEVTGPTSRADRNVAEGFVEHFLVSVNSSYPPVEFGSPDTEEVVILDDDSECLILLLCHCLLTTALSVFRGKGQFLGI